MHTVHDEPGRRSTARRDNSHILSPQPGQRPQKLGNLQGLPLTIRFWSEILAWTQKSVLGQNCCLLNTNQQWYSKCQPPSSHDYDLHGSKHVGIGVTLPLFLTQGNTFQEPRSPEIVGSFWIDFLGFSQTHSKKSTLNLGDFKDGLRIGSLSSFCNFC